MSDFFWWKGKWFRFGTTLLASAYFAYYASTPAQWHFLDFVNLVIHEAGHWVFFPFGEFIRILGGSLFQCVFPLIYVGYFFLRRDYFSASLLMFWVGQNLINVSVYASDAIQMQLPLLGGDSVMHDWNYILGATHLLVFAPQIGYGLYVLGAMTIGLAILLSVGTSQLEEGDL